MTAAEGLYPMPATADPDTGEVWNYCGNCRPKDGDDARKIVTLMEGGMVWVGIRAYHHRDRYWMNGGEPERAEVLAWKDLPSPATKRWVRGILA